MENYFAYILIRKDKVVNEGDRIQLSSGYNGYVHRITPRVTYVRHGLNESLAIIPTKQIVTAEIVNFTKEIKLVPAVVDVGVSYLNDPKQVASILVKVGKRAMNEVVDSRGRHLVRQNRCPYLDQYKASCGCDKDIHVDVTQPVAKIQQLVRLLYIKTQQVLGTLQWVVTHCPKIQQVLIMLLVVHVLYILCLLYTSPSPRDS